jgi:hypothetical protein
LIASTAVDSASPCEAACYRGLERIAATVDAVDYIHLCQSGEPQHGVARRAAGPIEVQLKCVGGGPILDFQDAAEFLARFQPLIDAALRRRLQ